MNTVQRIAKNTGVLLTSQAISYLLGFFYTMYSARYLGAEKFGILSFALAFAGIFSVFVDLGLNIFMIREVARDKSLAGKYLGNIFIMKITLSIIIFMLIILTINLLPYPEQTVKVVNLIALSVLFNALTSVFYSIFQAFEKMEYQSLGQVLNSVLMLGGVIFAINQNYTIIGFSYLYFFASLIVLGFSFTICMLKFVKPNIGIDWGLWKQIIKSAYPIGIMAICNIIRFRADTVMLSLMKNDSAVGLYNAAYKLLDASVVLPSIIMASIIPIMSQYYKNSLDSFNMFYERMFKYLFIIALPIALTITLLARPIINLVYGINFEGSANALQVLIWAVTSMYVSMLVGAAYITADKQDISMKLTILSVTLNIIFNLFLIPRYSYVGASAATVITEFFGLFIGVFFLSKYGHKLNILNNCIIPLINVALASILAVFLINIGVNIFLTVTITIMLYGFATYKLIIKEDDKQLIKNTFNSLRIKKIKKGWLS